MQTAWKALPYKNVYMNIYNKVVFTLTLNFKVGKTNTSQDANFNCVTV
jgi:hypothetical protein